METTNIVIVSLAFTGAYNLVFGIMNDTRNFRSAVAYKFIPALTGIACLFSAVLILVGK